MKTKFVVSLLSIAFVISILSLSMVQAKVVSGSCGVDGDNVTYKLDTVSGVLTLSGDGNIAGYYFPYSSPLQDNGSIKDIIIEDGITSIGGQVFFSCQNVKSVFIGNSVTTIESYAFSHCYNLQRVKIPISVTHIGRGAFSFTNITDVYYAGTEEEWNDIDIVHKENSQLLNAKFHYGYDSDDIFITEWDYEKALKETEIPYFSPNEAKIFIGFLYNTRHLNDEMLTSGRLYDFLTGQMKGSPEEELFKRIFLATSYDLISKNIESASANAERGYQLVIDSLLEIAGMPDGEVSAETVMDDAFTSLKYVASMVAGETSQEVKALFDILNQTHDLANLKDNALDIVEKLKVCIGTVEASHNAGYRDMYNYYLTNVNMKPFSGYSDGLVNNWLADFNINNSYIGHAQKMIDKVDFLGLTDKYNLNWTSEECISYLEEWANFTYLVELSLENTVAESAPQKNTQHIIEFDSNSEYSDDYIYVYTPQDNNWQIPELERAGYEIDSWYWDEALTKPVEGLVSLQERMKFFAKWSAIFGFDTDKSSISISKLNVDDTIVEIPEKIDGAFVKAIKEKAFENCYDLSEVIIPNSVVSIDKNSFKDCSDLTIKAFKFSAAYYYARNSKLPFIDIAPEVFLGDITNDKLHNLADFKAMAYSIVHKTLPDDCSNANSDIDADCKISLKDLRLLTRIISNENNQ